MYYSSLLSLMLFVAKLLKYVLINKSDVHLSDSNSSKWMAILCTHTLALNTFEPLSLGNAVLTASLVDFLAIHLSFLLSFFFLSAIISFNCLCINFISITLSIEFNIINADTDCLKEKDNTFDWKKYQ